jgi:hypothetical protein
MKHDIRLRLYLTYTYDNDSNTSIKRLAKFFDDSEEEARDIVKRLAALKLVEVSKDKVKKIHKHTSIPNSSENFLLRKNLLIKSFERTIKPDSYITNYHLGMTEDSYRKVLAFFDFIGANLIKLDQEDTGNTEVTRFQIALTGNRLTREKINEEEK